MTDKELLELAAKAAGVELINLGFDGGPHHKGTTQRWNPLDDDSDALRLAVKLGLNLFQSKHYVRCGRKTINMPAEEPKQEQDPLVATRRAIVRAAAEIGKEMNT